MQRSTVIVGALTAGVAIALITSIGGFATLAENQSNSKREQDEKLSSMMSDVKDIKSSMSMMIERMDTVLEGMDMMIGIMTGDILPGDMMGTMGDMMTQEPQDVIIERKSGHIVQVGKEAELLFLVLDKETEEPMEGQEVVVGIERGSSMSTMEMMGDMFEAENKGSGEYIVRFTPDTEGQYTIHIHVMIPGKSMMDNHLDFGVIAE